VKRGVLLGIAAVVILVSAFSLGIRHYRSAVLTSRELAQKQPKPPELPEDCAEIRRAVALSATSIASGHEKAAKITAPLDTDGVAIYKAVIQQWNSDHTTPLNVSAKTFPLDTTFSPEGSECGCWAGFSAKSLLKASHSFHILTQGDVPEAGVRLVYPNKQNAIVAQNDPSVTMRAGRPVTEAVDSAFANGLFSMSEIVFDRDHQHALVSYAFHCGSLCGNGATLVFERVNGQWKETDRMCGGWVS